MPAGPVGQASQPGGAIPEFRLREFWVLGVREFWVLGVREFCANFLVVVREFFRE